MIVKKVQTNKAAAPKSKALHARDLCDYIAGSDAGDADEKVEHRGAVNLLNIDHAAQVQEIGDLAETARRSPQPLQHWIVSWRQGEQPTPAQADEAVRMFLAELGLDEHQCVYALHRNTDNYHLHLAINRVHPDTERIATVNGGFDIEVAHRAIARIERAQGWQREARGRYRVLDGGEVRRSAPVAPTGRQPTALARDFENQTGQKSAQRTAIEEGADVLRRARDWDQLHSLLAERGMRFEKKGSGAVLWIGDVAVKASTAGRDCSMSALQRRLGDFTPVPDDRKSRRRAPEPIEPDLKTWKAYNAERQALFAEKTQKGEVARTQHRDERGDMLARHRQERRAALAGDWRGTGVALNVVRSTLAARQAQEKAELRERQQVERDAWRVRFPRLPDYEEWLREKASPELAERWRFRDRTPASIVGDQADPARPRNIRAFTAEARGWEVLYRRTDAPGAPACFADRGREIRIHDFRRDSVLAALQLSAQKWGTFHVFGSDDYKRLCVSLAAEHGFRITNPELQDAIARRRDRPRSHESVRHDPAPPVPTPMRVAVRDAAEAYRAHIEDVRGRLRGRDVDASRVDALVAVRLRVTSYDRNEIERAIRSEAARARPHEMRDWNEYAKRAAGHAFGISGQRELQALAQTRERLFALEGRLPSRERSLDMPPRRSPQLGR